MLGKVALYLPESYSGFDPLKYKQISSEIDESSSEFDKELLNTVTDYDEDACFKATIEKETRDASLSNNRRFLESHLFHLATPSNEKS